MRRILIAVTMGLCWVPPICAQTDAIEIPLRMEGGRLLLTADGPHGEQHDFVLGLARNAVSQSGSDRLGQALSAMSLGGIRIDLEGAPTLPDAALTLEDGTTPVGVIGGEALHPFDVLIDVPGGRLVLKRSGRSVRWDGLSLSSPVATRVFHDALIRVDVEVGGKLVGGLLDFVQPTMGVNEPLRSQLGEGATRMSSFRMGYSGWDDLPAEVIDDPLFRGWDPDGNGFVVVGAAVAAECMIAVSWQHAELRTCVR
jgi:hypothetical protein